MTSQPNMKEETATEPDTTDPCNTYKSPVFTPLITTLEPLWTFNTLPLVVQLHPNESRVPKEIKFLFKLGAC